MKVRKLIALLGAAALAGSLLATPAAAKAKATVVGTDAEGDWGANVEPNLAPIGDALGQDLTGASISFDGKTINFVIQLNSLPASGGVPELSRYTWDFSVDGEFAELDGKFTNYTRGACDPTAASCPPPRDPGQQPFAIRANCTTTQNVTTCEEVGLVQATFDAAEGTITIPVPPDLIGAKKGSKIAPAMGDFNALVGGSVVAVPAAFFSNSAAPSDALVVTKTFVVK